MEDSDLPCFKLFDLEKFRARFLEDKDEKYVFLIIYYNRFMIISKNS